MNLIDIIIIAILVLFTWKGFRAGLVGAVGGFLGILVGIWAGTHYMTVVAGWLATTLNINNESLNNILAFILIFIAINIIASIVVWIINRIFHIIPFINMVDKMLGAIIGFLGASLAAAALIYLLSLFPISDRINEMILNSNLAAMAADLAVLVKPFVPEAIRQLRSIWENAG